MAEYDNNFSYNSQQPNSILAMIKLPMNQSLTTMGFFKSLTKTISLLKMIFPSKSSKFGWGLHQMEIIHIGCWKMEFMHLLESIYKHESHENTHQAYEWKSHIEDWLHDVGMLCNVVF